MKLFNSSRPASWPSVVIIATMLCTAPSMASDDTVKVFLLGGQSNMFGRGLASELPVAIQSPQADVLFYYDSSLTQLQPGSGVVAGVEFGPEVTFGRTIADALPQDDFALIKYARSGSSLCVLWDPTPDPNLNLSGDAYEAFRDTVANGLTALTSAGRTPEIVGMLWTQGERDAKIDRTAAQYQADLVEFIADVRSRYGIDLPFFLSRLSSNQTAISTTQLANIRTAQENVAASDTSSYLIDTDGFSLNTDYLHFDAAGQMDLGEAFGASYIAAAIASTTTMTWDVDGMGDWNTDTNWDPAAVPNANTDTAIFGAKITFGATVFTDAAVTVKAVEFNNANFSYVIAGTGSVDMEADLGDASITVTSGNHEFHVQVNLANNTNIDVEVGETLSFNHELDLADNILTKTGTGTMIIKNTQFLDAGGTIDLQGGSLQLQR